MHLSIYSIPNIIIGVYIAFLGCVILIANHKKLRNVSFFLLSLLTSAWQLSYGIAYTLTDKSQASFLLKLGHASAVLMTPLVFLFLISILGKYRSKIDIPYFVISIAYAHVSIYWLYTNNYYLIDVTRRFWGYSLLGGPLMIVYSAFTFCLAFYTIKSFLRASKLAKTELRFDDYQRFKYCALSLCIFIIASIDYLPKFGLDFYPFGFVFVAGSASLMTYAIARHNLLDVDLVIRKSFVYSLLISSLTFIYLTLIFFGEAFFRTYLGYKSFFVGFLSAIIIAITFNPLRSKIQRFIDKRFLKVDPETLLEENVKMKAELQKQDQMKAVATLAAGMAHEIKNPLTSIKTFAEFLPTKYDDPVFREKFNRIVVDEVDRVNNIVKQVLEFSRPQDPELKETTLKPVIEETIALLQNNLVTHNIELIKKIGSSDKVLADKNQLKQAFLNLFLNSIQAMPDGGKLWVSTSHKDSKTEITIIDTGAGIQSKDISKVFDPFFTTKENGTGLGLSIVHGIVHKHGGKIQIKSKLGEGTTVSVILRSRS